MLPNPGSLVQQARFYNSAKLNDNVMLQYPKKRHSYVPELQITTVIASEQQNI